MGRTYTFIVPKQLFCQQGLKCQTHKVKVTDLLYEKTENRWNQKISSNENKRATTLELERKTEQQDMIIRFYRSLKQMEKLLGR